MSRKTLLIVVGFSIALLIGLHWFTQEVLADRSPLIYEYVYGALHIGGISDEGALYDDFISPIVIWFNRSSMYSLATLFEIVEPSDLTWRFHSPTPVGKGWCAYNYLSQRNYGESINDTILIDIVVPIRQNFTQEEFDLIPRAVYQGSNLPRTFYYNNDELEIIQLDYDGHFRIPLNQREGQLIVWGSFQLDMELIVLPENAMMAPHTPRTPGGLLDDFMAYLELDVEYRDKIYFLQTPNQKEASP